MSDAVPADASPEITSIRRQCNGVDLHVVAAGDPDDPLVVLLHGFPGFWYGWCRQLGRLVNAGYRVLVPDQRGYNRSEKPAGVEHYRIAELSADVRDLIRGTGRESAHVVGHDWGAMVAWDLALRRPSAVDRLGIVNGPHPTAYEETVRSSVDQLRRSWYAAFFQLPTLPERLLARGDYRLLERALRASGAPSAFDDADLDRYRSAWRRTGALTGMLDWYRAAARYRDRPPRETVAAPTLIVWGNEDVALVPALASKSLAYCEDGRLERFPGRSHWVHREVPERVTDALLDHLSG